MNQMRKITRRFSIQLYLHLTLHRFMVMMIPLLFGWGTIAIVLRLATGISTLFIFSGFLLSLPVLMVALGLQYVNHPPPSSIYATFDLLNASGGIFMAAMEQPLPIRYPGLDAIRSPRIVWQNYHNRIIFGIAVLYIICAGWVPPVPQGIRPPAPFEIAPLVDAMNQKIELLKEENIIDPPSQEALESQLRLLENNAEGSDPVTTLESLDHLNERLHAKAAAFGDTTTKALDALQQAQNMTAILNQLPLSTRHDRQALIQELAKMLQAAANNPFPPPKILNQKLTAALKKGRLTSKELAQLQKKLAMNQTRLKKSLTRLVQSHLIAKTMCQSALSYKSSESTELAQFIKENAPHMKTDEIVYMCRRKGTGSGAIKRGRADAVLTWQEKADESSVKFKATALPLTALSLNQKNIMVGQSGYAPQPLPDNPSEKMSETASVIGQIADNGGTPVHQSVLPCHRGPVSRYFKRTESPYDAPSP